MKKIISCFLGLSILFAISYAEGIGITFNGEPVITDVPPMMINDRVMIPVRAILERAGAKVDFDINTNKITIKNSTDTVELTLGSNIAYVNGEEKTLDVPATEINDRTLIPVRFVSESLGLNVVWEDEIVKITNYVSEKEVSEPEITENITPELIENKVPDGSELSIEDLENLLFGEPPSVPEVKLEETQDILEKLALNPQFFNGDIVGTLKSTDNGLDFDGAVWIDYNDNGTTYMILETKANNEESKTVIESIASMMNQIQGIDVTRWDNKITIKSDANIEGSEIKGMSRDEIVQYYIEKGYNIILK